MITVQDIVGKKKTGDLGIEIEVESKSTAPVAPAPVWSLKRDDSLRNVGYEYFTTKPIKCDTTKKDKIKSLTELFKEHPIILDSPRTSVHVHVNVCRHTPLQLWTAVCTYWLLDNLLLKYCGEDQREGNVFCLRAKDAEGSVQQAIYDLKGRIPFNSLRGDSVRYSSQNLNAVTHFGSLEYRGMRGTIDPDIIDVWTTELYNIVHRSKRFSSPSEMLDYYFTAGAKGVMATILSAPFITALEKYDIDNLVKDNVGVISELCYLHDWRKWEQRINEIKYIPQKEIFDDFDN